MLVHLDQTLSRYSRTTLEAGLLALWLSSHAPKLKLKSCLFDDISVVHWDQFFHVTNFLQNGS